MTQTYEAWRITYQSCEQAARAAFERMMELEQGKCLHHIAEPAQTARPAFEAISCFMKCEWSLDWDKAGFYDDAKVDAAFTWFEQGFMRAQLAAAPQTVQPAVPAGGQSRFKGEKDWQWCSPEHVAMVLATPSEWQGYEVRYLYAAPAHPAEGVPTSSDLRERLARLEAGCNAHTTPTVYEAIADSKAALDELDEARQRVGISLAATQPAAQGLDALNLTAHEYKQLLKAIEDYQESGETDVPDETLIRGVAAGYLECGHFKLINLAALVRDAAAAGVA